MQLTIGKDELEKAMQVVTPALNLGGKELATQFVIRVKEQGGTYAAELLGSSGRVFAGCPMICSEIIPAVGCPMPFSFTVDGWRLKMWLKAITDSPAIQCQYQDKGTMLVLKAGKGRVAKFPVCDPAGFPFWDQTLENTSHTATVEVEYLSDTLSYVKEFVSTQESKYPQLCVAETKEGVLCATNKVAAVAIWSQTLDKATFRLHYKDFSSILTFLGSFQPKSNVEIWESDRVCVLHREDGAMFGETRFSTPLPNLTITKDDTDLYWIDFSRTEVLSAIALLSPSAVKGDGNLNFEVHPSEKVVRVWMQSGVRNETVSMDVECKGSGGKNIPSFSLPYPPLQKVLAYCPDDLVRMGINHNPKKAGAGWVSFRQDRGGDRFQTILAWVQK